MKKSVKVEDIIRYARKEVCRYHKYMNECEYDLARMQEYRIDACQTIIMVLAVGFCLDFEDKWEEIHREIHREIWGE